MSFCFKRNLPVSMGSIWWNSTCKLDNSNSRETNVHMFWLHVRYAKLVSLSKVVKTHLLCSINLSLLGSFDFPNSRNSIVGSMIHYDCESVFPMSSQLKIRKVLDINKWQACKCFRWFSLEISRPLSCTNCQKNRIYTWLIHSINRSHLPE